MTLTIELPDDVMAKLVTAASEQGLPLAAFVQRLLIEHGSTETLPKTGAELVAYWQKHGVIGCRPDITDSQKHARELRARAERRTKD